MRQEMEQLLAQLESCQAYLASNPAKRQLKFGIIEGRGNIQGDELRVRLCASLYNARETISRLIRHATKPPSNGVQIALAIRYSLLLESAGPGRTDVPQDLWAENLLWMAERIAQDGIHLPRDKVGRWLGFIQAGCVVHGFLTVQQERDSTREYFHAAYQEEGLDIPPTLQRPSQS